MEGRPSILDMPVFVRDVEVFADLDGLAGGVVLDVHVLVGCTVKGTQLVHWRLEGEGARFGMDDHVAGALREHVAQDFLEQRLVVHLLGEIVVPIHACEVATDHFDALEVVCLVCLRQQLHGPVQLLLLRIHQDGFFDVGLAGALHVNEGRMQPVPRQGGGLFEELLLLGHTQQDEYLARKRKEMLIELDESLLIDGSEVLAAARSSTLHPRNCHLLGLPCCFRQPQSLLCLLLLLSLDLLLPLLGNTLVGSLNPTARSASRRHESCFSGNGGLCCKDLNAKLARSICVHLDDSLNILATDWLLDDVYAHVTAQVIASATDYNRLQLVTTANCSRVVLDLSLQAERQEANSNMSLHPHR